MHAYHFVRDNETLIELFVGHPFLKPFVCIWAGKYRVWSVDVHFSRIEFKGSKDCHISIKFAA